MNADRLVPLLMSFAIIWPVKQIGAVIARRPVAFSSHRLYPNVLPHQYAIDLDLRARSDLMGFVEIGVSINKWETREGEMGTPSSSVPPMLGKQAPPSHSIGKRVDNDAKNLILMHVDKEVAVYDIKYHKTIGARQEYIHIDHYLFDEERQLMGIVFVKDLEVGSKGVLNIQFRPPSRTDLRGLHFIEHSTINDGNEKQYRTYLTKFQPSDARLFMPCFDEPEFKAKFHLRLNYDRKFTALSNTYGKFQLYKTKVKLMNFKETGRIPIHMFAFAVGEFDSMEKRRIARQSIMIRVNTTPGLKKKAEYALGVASEAIMWMEHYTDSNFPPGKFDILCVLNHDKDNTENWGFAIIRSRLCLLDDGTHGRTRILIAINIAHVVAHQWYGNLVTAKWWDSLWVTEGAAAFLAFKIVKNLYPFIDSGYVVQFDILSNTIVNDNRIEPGHNLAMEHTAVGRNAMDLFDSLEFTKSGSLFKLIENNIGEENFRLALRRLSMLGYQSGSDGELEHPFGSVDKDDLASALQKPDLELFGAQIHQSHAPELNFKLLETGDKPQLKCEQSLSIARYLDVTLHFYEYTRGEKSRHISQDVDLRSAVISYPEWFDFSNKNHYMMINPTPDVSQYFHINIDKSLDQNFERVIKDKRTDPIGRATLLEHAIRSYKIRGPDYTEHLEKWLDFYKNEEETSIMLRILEAMKLLAAQGRRSEVLRSFYEIIERVYSQGGDFFSVNSLHIGDEPDTKRSAIREQERTDALTLLVASDNENVIRQARRLFVSTGGRIDQVYLRVPVYMAVVKYGGEEEVRLLVGNLITTDSLEERSLIVALLASFNRFKINDDQLQKFCSNKHKFLPIDRLEAAKNMCEALLTLKRKNPHDEAEVWSENIIRSLFED